VDLGFVDWGILMKRLIEWNLGKDYLKWYQMPGSKEGIKILIFRWRFPKFFRKQNYFE
jgi:hypothetical protein